MEPRRRNPLRRYPTAVCISVLHFGLTQSKTRALNGPGSFLPAAFAPKTSAARFLYFRPLQWLGMVSYSVYMVHYAALWFVNGFLRVVTHAQDVILPFRQE